MDLSQITKGIASRFQQFANQKTQEHEAQRQAALSQVAEIGKRFSSWATNPIRQIEDVKSQLDTIDLRKKLGSTSIDTTPIQNLYQKFTSGAKDYAKNIDVTGLQSRFNDYMSKQGNDYITQAEAARKSGVWMPPQIPLLQGQKQNIEKIPVVGGLLSAMTTMPDEQVNSIEALRRGETISKDQASMLNQDTLSTVMGMATPVKAAGLRKGVPGAFTNVRELDNPLLMGKNWAQEGKEALNSVISKARAAKDPMGVTEPFDNMVRQAATDVRHKVNFLDYFATPEKVLTKIGLGPEAKQLRTSYDKYLDELPQEINKIKGWMERVPDKDSNQRIFQWLDGKKVQLIGEEVNVAQEVKSYLAGWADRLGLPKDKRISNYITHIFPKNEAGEFDSEIANLIKNEVAGSVYNPFLQKRTNQAGYIENWVEAVQAYTKRAVRKANMDPILEKIKSASENLESSQFNYVKTKIDQINLRPTDIDNLLDNAIKQSPIGYKFGNRPTTVITQKARQMVYRGLLGLNPGSALKNLTQVSNTYAELGEKHTAIGYLKVMQNLPNFLRGADTELEKVGVLRDNFMMDTKQLTAWKTLLQKTDDVLFYMFNLAEKINRGGAYFGAKAKAHTLGMNEADAVNYAKEIVRKTQFTFGSIDTPAVLGSDIMKTIFQFQSYTMKQFEFLGEKMTQKDFAGLARYVGSTYLLAATFGKFLGWEPKDLFPGLRVGTPPTLQLPYGLYQAATQSTDKYGNELTPTQRLLNQNVTKGALSYVPAGGLNKTYQGIKAIQEGGSYTPSGNLRYPVEPSWQSAVLGPSRTNGGNKYYSDGAKPLGEKQTEQYKQLVISGMSPQKAYDLIAGQRNKDEQFKQLLNPTEESITGKVQGFIQNLFSPKVQELQSQSNDPIISAYQSEIENDKKASQIKEIFGLGLSQEETAKVLDKAGFGSYQDASYIILRALSVESGSRGSAIRELVKGLTGSELTSTLRVLGDEKILTNSVINQWLDDGQIDETKANVLKKLLKGGTGSGSGSKKAKNAPALKSLTIETPSTPSFRLSPATSQYRGVKLPSLSPQQSLTRGRMAMPRGYEPILKLRVPVQTLGGLGR